MKLPLVMALFLLSALPARAEDSAPQLVALSNSLAQKQDDSKKGVLPPDKYREFLVEFRASLDATMTKLPPTAENKGLYAQILARLDDEGAVTGSTSGRDRTPREDPKAVALRNAKAGKQANTTATALLSTLNSGDDGPATAGDPSASSRRPGAGDEGKPYKLAVQGKINPIEVPLEGPQSNAGPRLRSNSTGLWGRAADGLVIYGAEWSASADQMGENGVSGFGKFATKCVGKSLTAAGGLMDATTAVSAWSFDKNVRMLTGDLSVIPETGRDLYAFGKTVAVGVVDDTCAAAKDWGDLATLKKPTTYQALKATAKTEAILANFLPVGAAGKGAGAVLETAEVAGETAGRRALVRTAVVGGRELGEEGVERGLLGSAETVCPPGSACGLASRREFIVTESGGPIRKLTSQNVRITRRGIDVVEKHIARFGQDAPNEVMVRRLKEIAEGRLSPTAQDLDFYAHELREYVRYKNLGAATGRGGERALWNNTHTATLEEYGIKDADRQLYHPEANVSGQ